MSEETGRGGVLSVAQTEDTVATYMPATYREHVDQRWGGGVYKILG